MKGIDRPCTWTDLLDLPPARPDTVTDIANPIGLVPRTRDTFLKLRSACPPCWRGPACARRAPLPARKMAPSNLPRFVSIASTTLSSSSLCPSKQQISAASPLEWLGLGRLELPSTYCELPVRGPVARPSPPRPSHPVLSPSHSRAPRGKLTDVPGSVRLPPRAPAPLPSLPSA